MLLKFLDSSVKIILSRFVGLTTNLLFSLKFLIQLISISKHVTTLAGLEFASNDTKNLLVLKKYKKELFVEKSSQLQAIAEVASAIPGKSPLFLVINTEKVLFKEIQANNDPQKAIAEAFPNLKIEDFYYEILNIEAQTFVAICRKDDVDILIEECQHHALNVVGFSLGNLTTSNLAQLLDIEKFSTSNSTIDIVENSISNIAVNTSTPKTHYNINGLEVSNNDVLPLAGAIGYYAKQKKTLTNFNHVNVKLSDEYEQKQRFDVGLKASLAIVFILLLVSVLLYSSYASKINAIQSELEMNNTYKNSLLKLSDEVAKKERLVTDYSLVSSKASWYLDHIGSSVPGSILLTDIQFQPLSKPLKKDTQVLFTEHAITIKGKSGSSDDFIKWTNDFEQTDWIQKVTIKDYGTGKKTTTAFELLIEVK